MGVSKDKFLIAIDTTTEEDEEPVEVPAKLGKLLRKHGEELGLKVLILWSKDSTDTEYFDSKVLEKCSNRIQIIDSRNLMIFKIGIAIGQGIHTVLYSSSKDWHLRWMNEVYKEMIDARPNQITELGMIQVLKQSKLPNFDQKILASLEDLYEETICPDKFKLETESSNYEPWIGEILEKLAKQFNKIEKMDIWKFTNTCNNIITQHISSSGKNKLPNTSVCKKYMLSWVIQKLLNEKFISNKLLDEYISTKIFETKEIIDLWNVEIKETFQSAYNKIYSKLEILHADDSSSTAWTSFSNTMWTTMNWTTTNWTTTNESFDNRSTERSDSIFNNEMSLVGFDVSELSRMKNYIVWKFLIKYEQSNYVNIKKPSKFINAVSNFVAQTLESKQFNKTFKIKSKEDSQDKVPKYFNFI